MIRFGCVMLAAAALLGSGRAEAARYYEFELTGVAPVTYYDPFGVQQPVSFNRASRFTVSFDTAVDNGIPLFFASGVAGVTTVFSAASGTLRTLNMPGGVYFDLGFDPGRIQEGADLRPVAASGSYGYLNCDNRYQVCTTIPVSQFTFTGRTSDIAPAFLGERETSLLTSVPEPAAWAMTIVGIGAIGGVMRRRPKVRTAVTYA